MLIYFVMSYPSALIVLAYYMYDTLQVGVMRLSLLSEVREDRQWRLGMRGNSAWLGQRST